MPDTDTGSQPPSELTAPAASEASVELSQANPQATPPVAAAVPPSPELVALQQQLAASQAQAATFEQRYKDTQGAYTKSQQALQALSGGLSQQQEPPNPAVAYLVSEGYSAKDAEIMAKTVGMMVQPLQQQLQQAQAVVQSTMAVDSVLNGAFGLSPQAFSNPTVYAQVQAQLQQDASQGYRIEPGYAAQLAKQFWFDATYPSGQPGAQPPQQPPPTQQMRPQVGNPGNFGGQFPQPRQQVANRTADQVSFEAEISRRMNVK